MVYFWLTIQTLIASFTHIIAKAVVKEIPPLTLTLFRSAIAGLGFGFLLRFSKYKEVKIERRDWFKFLLLGVLAVPLNQFAFILGIKYTTPANASLIYAMTPIFALIFFRAFIGGEDQLLQSRWGYFKFCWDRCYTRGERFEFAVGEFKRRCHNNVWGDVLGTLFNTWAKGDSQIWCSLCNRSCSDDWQFDLSTVWAI
jgi:uncharacterized membrane protein